MAKPKKLVEPLKVAKEIRFLVCRACGNAITDGALCSYSCMFDTQTERPRVALGLATYMLSHVEAVTHGEVKWADNPTKDTKKETQED